MNARLDSLVRPSCCAAPVAVTGGCCSRHYAARDAGPALVGDLAELTERGVEFVVVRMHTAWKGAAAARQ